MSAGGRKGPPPIMKPPVPEEPRDIYPNSCQWAHPRRHTWRMPGPGLRGWQAAGGLPKLGKAGATLNSIGMQFYIKSCSLNRARMTAPWVFHSSFLLLYLKLEFERKGEVSFYFEGLQGASGPLLCRDISAIIRGALCFCLS